MKKHTKHVAKLEKSREAVREMAIRISTELRGRPPTAEEIELLEAKLEKKFADDNPDAEKR